jgi:5-methylthioribose kinase
MGFDIGAVIANLLLNYAAHEGHTPDPQEREAYQAYLLETVSEVWRVFETEFRTLWEEQAQEPYAKTPGYLDAYLLDVLKDAAGYAGCKMMRRVIGLAHVSDLESIADPALRAKGETLALCIGQELVLQRGTLSGIDDVIKLIAASAVQN